MKKKVLYGAALALFASVSMGTLQSCKDDLSDLSHQNAYDHQGFTKQIDGLRTDVDALKIALGQCQTNCANEIDALKTSIAGLQKQINDNKADADATKVLAQKLEQELKKLSSVVEAMYTNEQIDEKLGNLKTLIETYLNDSKKYTDEQIGKLQGILEGKITDEVIKLNAAITALDEKLGGQISGLSEQISGLTEQLGQFNTKLEGIIETQSDLVTRVTKLEADYEIQIGAIKAVQDEIDLLWKNSEEQSELISQVYNALKSELDELGLEYARLSNEFELLNESIFGDGGLRDQISQAMQALRTEFTDADEELWLAIYERDERLTQFYNTLRLEFAEADEELWNAIYERDIIMTQYYEALRNEFTEADEEIYKTIEAVREEATMFWNATNASLDELKNEDEQLWQQLTQVQDMIGQVLNVHKADIEALEAKVDALQAKYDNLLGRVDKLITGILIQATDNPIFGNFSLPMGVKNNMLFNWYGYNKSLIKKFPSNSNNYAYNDDVAGVDFNTLDAPFETVQQGFMGNVNLGRVYLTVNPVGHNFDNTKFTLETSKGTPLPFGLKITPSNDELFFGYTRGAENGFYAADVIIDGDQNAINAGISATKLTIDDGLKSAVKNVLKDRTKRNALNLLKAVYGQISNQLPAYAVRYDWTDADGNPYAVLSNYELAIASAKPLSYQFYYGESINHKLRTFGHIQNIFYHLMQNENLKFDFTKYALSFDGGKYEINIKPLVIDDQTVSVSGGKVTVQIPEITVYQVVDGVKVPIGVTEPTLVEVKDNDLNNLYEAIEEGIKNAIDNLTSDITGWTDDLSEEVNGKINTLLSDVQSEINKMLQEIGDDITGRIDTVLGGYGDKVEPWFKRLNRLIDLYDKVANKINDILDDPNHLLQVAMFYQGGRAGINLVSNSKASPTPFVGSKGYVGLYASSYTAELVAPAFKKYVAVSNVYNADGSDYEGAKAAMERVNGKNHFNEVMDGMTIRYSIPVENLEKNKIYEIVYQGLDFHGVTSTQKFYITVK